MKIPESFELLRLDNEEETLDKLSELDGLALLDLQAVADKITELIAIIFMAREYGAQEEDGNSNPTV